MITSLTQMSKNTAGVLFITFPDSFDNRRHSVWQRQVCISYNAITSNKAQDFRVFCTREVVSGPQFLHLEMIQSLHTLTVWDKCPTWKCFEHHKAALVPYILSNPMCFVTWRLCLDDIFTNLQKLVFTTKQLIMSFGQINKGSAGACSYNRPMLAVAFSSNTSL